MAGDLAGSQVGIGGKVVQIQADGFATVLFVDGAEPAGAERRPLPRTVQAHRSLAALGRERELARLADAVEEGGPVQVYGPCGIGKSTLLLHATSRGTLGATGTEGTVLLSARGLPAQEVLQEILLATYQVTAVHVPAQAERRRLLAALRVLVVLDDLDCPAAEVADLVHALPHCVVVTAAERMTATGGCTVGLRGLPLPAALTLFQDALDRPLSAREAVQAEEAWRATDGHPGRLGLVAAYLREAAEHGIPPAVPPADGLPLVIPQLVSWLSTEAAALLRQLSVLGDSEWGMPLVHALPDGTATAVDELVRARLLVRNQARLRLAQGVAAGLGDDPPGSTLPTVAEAAAGWLAGAAPTDAAAEAEVLTALAQQAADAGLDALVTRLARAGAPRLMLALRWRAWGRLLDVGLQAARRSKRSDDEVYFTHESGIRALCLGDVVKATALLSAAAALGVRGAATLRELLNDPPAPSDPGTTAVAQPPGPPPAAPPPAPSPAAGPWHHGLLTGKALLAAAAVVAATTFGVNAFGGQQTTKAGPPSTAGPQVTGGHRSTTPTRSAVPDSSAAGQSSADHGAGPGSAPASSDQSAAASDPWQDFPFGGRRIGTAVYANGFRYDVIGAVANRDAGGRPQLLLTSLVRNELAGPSRRPLGYLPVLHQGGRQTSARTDTTAAGSDAVHVTFTFPLEQGFRWEDARLEFPADADEVTTVPLVPGSRGGPLIAHPPQEAVIYGKLRNAWMEVTMTGAQYRTDVALDSPGWTAPRLRAGRASLLLTFTVQILDAPPGGVDLAPQDFDVIQPNGTRRPFEVGTSFGGYAHGVTPKRQYIAVQVAPATGTYRVVFTYAAQDARPPGNPQESLTFTVGRT
ncbi:hypothetical protein ABZ721_14810 [Streptomyces sp. NPDC006733]|uniref:hypothetical protein n=1 Tax=Streptomyces sp. NPDC006733 TaxID=3155460 RepID=UPI0034080613